MRLPPSRLSLPAFSSRSRSRWRTALRRRAERTGSAPGLTAGQLVEAGQQQTDFVPARVTCLDYGPDYHRWLDPVPDLEALLAAGRPDAATVRWIHVAGLQDTRVLASLAAAYDLHPLAMEDIVHLGQRPKAEAYGPTETGRPRLFVVSRMLHLNEDHLPAHGQMSMFIGPHTVLTFQENGEDFWQAIRQRIAPPESRFRQRRAGYLAYTLLDMQVDALFPVLDHYIERIEQVEEYVLMNPDKHTIHAIHDLKRELMLLRREVWPMRELIRSLLDHDPALFDEQTRLHLRDVGDHTVAAIELIETSRELVSGLGETWMTAMSNRMNEVIKTLTLIASIFIPISFLAGVFGTNFDSIPLLHSAYGFVFFCLACLGTVVGMSLWFRRRGWM